MSISKRQALRDHYPFHRHGALVSMGYRPPAPLREKKNGLEVFFWIVFCSLGSSGILALGLSAARFVLRAVDA